MHRVRVEPGLCADRHRHVPAVDEVLGEELLEVFGGRGVAAGEVHGAVDGAGVGGGDLGLRGRLPSRRDRVGAELVTVESVADLVDGPAGEQRNAPPVLVHHVVDERADVPVRAGCRVGPLAGLDLSTRSMNSARLRRYASSRSMLPIVPVDGAGRAVLPGPGAVMALAARLSPGRPGPGRAPGR